MLGARRSFPISTDVSSAIRKNNIIVAGYTNWSSCSVIGTDYYSITNAVAVFGPGVTNVAMTIPIVNNSLPEGNRTVSMQLTSVTGSTMTGIASERARSQSVMASNQGSECSTRSSIGCHSSSISHADCKSVTARAS